MPGPGDVRRVVLRQLIAAYDEALQRIIAAYGRALDDLRPAIQRFENALGDEPLPAGTARRLPEYATLLDTTQQVMTRFAGVAENEARALSDGALGLGAQVALSMALATVRRAGNVALRDAWQTPDPAALAQLIGYVTSPAMRSKWEAFGANAADHLASVLVTGFEQGIGPREIARLMRNWQGVPYAWAENTTRTVQLWSWRMASHATYAANSDVVDGWVWWSAEDERTCLSCWSQHGTRHSVHDYLNDHHRGRCTPIPIVKGTTWADSVRLGPVVFADLPPATQQAVFGNAALYRAWQDGAVGWQDFSRPYDNDVYGEMLRQASLVDVLGAQAREYY